MRNIDFGAFRSGVDELGPITTGVTGWIALNPYFLWGSSTPLLGASLVVAAWVGWAWLRGIRPHASLVLYGGVVLSVFLVYITVLPKTDGGHIKWIYVLPTLAALLSMDTKQRECCLAWFSALFAISLVPGLLVGVAAAIGAPITFRGGMTMPGIGSPLLHFPGALFIETNSVVLPWGGVIFRVCSMYDEPGTVGTISALILAAHAYKWTNWRTPILYLAGLLSFSLAFLILTFIGMVATLLRSRGPQAAAIAFAIFLMLPASLLATGIWDLRVAYGTVSHINIVRPDGSTETFVASRDFGRYLRQTDSLDNRVTAQMANVLERYSQGDGKTLLLGIATDASVVDGNISATWKRVLTDYGLLGLSVYVVSLFLLVLGGVKSAGFAYTSLVFSAIYCISLYQRPIFWLPYALLLLVCSYSSCHEVAREAP